MDETELGQYRGMVYRFLLFLLRDAEASDDVVQETFQVAVSKGTDPGKGTDYAALLRSIARNMARNYVRKAKRAPVLLDAHLLDAAEGRFVASGAGSDEGWEARKQALRGFR